MDSKNSYEKIKHTDKRRRLKIKSKEGEFYLKNLQRSYSFMI